MHVCVITVALLFLTVYVIVLPYWNQYSCTTENFGNVRSVAELADKLGIEYSTRLPPSMTPMCPRGTILRGDKCYSKLCPMSYRFDPANFTCSAIRENKKPRSIAPKSVGALCLPQYSLNGAMCVRQ